MDFGPTTAGSWLRGAGREDPLVKSQVGRTGRLHAQR